MQPLADAEEQVKQLCQKELEAVDEVSENQENETEAYVIVSHEEKHVPGSSCSNTELLARSDVTTWDRLNKGDRDRIVANCPLPNPKEFPRDQTGGVFPTSILSKFMPNGESIRRDWLIWIDNCKALFCFSCCLFSLNELQTLRRNSWDSILDESKTVASSLGLNDHFKEKISRTRRQVDNDTNCNSECISDEERAFKIEVYYAALDTLLM